MRLLYIVTWKQYFTKEQFIAKIFCAQIFGIILVDNTIFLRSIIISKNFHLTNDN